MYSSQLLRVLQASLMHVNEEICSLDTDEPKATMKESPGRYTNPFLSDVENDEVNLWNNPVVEDNFTSNTEDEEFIKSLASRDVPSEFFETTNHFYTDKNIMECVLPELTACYKENGFHVVKDICVDEGLIHAENILIDTDHCEVFCNSAPVTGDKHNDMVEGGPKDDGDDDGASKCARDELKSFVESNTVQNVENCGPGKLMQPIQETLDLGTNLLDGASMDQLVSNSTLLVPHDRPLTSVKVLESSNNGVDNVDEQPYQSPVDVISKNPFIGSETEELATSGQTANINETEETITSDFDTGKPSSSSGPRETEDRERVDELPLETRQSTPNHQDKASSDHVTIANQSQHGEGELSFSVVDPVSSVISYSGPIAFSGSISLRSDSSTTSVRSFAFPILQTEWNSSPVRMAKAERSRLQKHRGWRQALLCCRF